MKLILTLLVGASVLSLVGCSALVNNISKSANALSAGNYTVTVWDGGLPVAEYHVVDSFVNTEEHTDGYFFFVDNKLVRVSGTVTVEQK